MQDAYSGPRWVRPIPNILTILRIVAAAILLLVPPPWRLPVIAFAGLSDWADGVVARRFHAESKFGALMDGVADKLFVLACVAMFVASGEIALWEGVLVMTRDLVVVAMTLACVVRGAWSAFHHMQVRLAGKLTTALVIPWFVSLLIPGLESTRPWLFWLAAGASVFAALDYIVQFIKRARLELRPGND